MIKRKWFKKGLAFTLAIVIAMETQTPLNAATLTNDVIKKSEQEKKSAENSKASLKKGLTDVKALIQELESAKNNLSAYITELDANLEKINANIETLKEQISDKEDEIEVTRRELEDAIWDSQEQYALMKKRIQFIYEKGKTSNVEMILNSTSFVEFLNRAEFVNQLSAYDRKMLDKYVETTQRISDTKAVLEEEEAQLEDSKSDLESEQSALEELIGSKEAEIARYESDIANKEAAVAEYEAEIAAQDEIIKALEQTIAAEKKKLEEQNKKARSFNGGKFTFPCPSYTRISDDYGMRMHPTLGVNKMHNGVDLAAPTGSAILAAYDGDVVAAAYSSSMGNYVMLDHGDGVYTIYMHASALYVSKGQSVSKGSKIAAVGSTGRSTGPHLHFGVRENGSYVSPWKYLK